LIALDSSALVAIALQEPEARAFAELIAISDRVVGRPTILETHLVLRDRAGQPGLEVLERILAKDTVTAVDFDEDHLRLARQAGDRYGRGRGHPARLNFGDCMAYAVAKAQNVPLVFKGEDFTHTDVAPARP